jgi:GT2 family glycosyltransferase
MATQTVDVQSAWVEASFGPGADKAWLRVETAVRLRDQAVVVTGWRSELVDVELRQDGQVLDSVTFLRDRGDVAQKLERESGEGLGFSVVIAAAGGGPIEIALAGAGAEEGLPLVLDDVAFGDAAALARIPDRERARIGTALPTFSDGWRQLVARTRSRQPKSNEAWSNIEVAVASQHHHAAVVAGWVLFAGHCTDIWFESENGEVYPFNRATLREREDVAAAYAGQHPTGPELPGFTIDLPGVRMGSVVRVRAVIEGDVVELTEATVVRLPEDPVKAAEWIFGITGASGMKFAQFVRRSAMSIIDPLIMRRNASWAGRIQSVTTVGQVCSDPKVSLVIPLYGRFDFVEHQLIEFSRDEWVKNHCEIIYVIDDPRIIDGFLTQIHSLHALYEVSFRVVWDGRNRGYSGANNLGADQATGEMLLFLNSDAIPQGPGWLETLVEGISSDPEIGVVAPRLVFANGSIQHAGMSFRYRGDLDIWTNHHPYMGIDPLLDPAGTEITETPAVTGACLLVRRSDFDTVGGWDPGYLIGDFEDSDFCLKVRNLGKKVCYVPGAQLTHLERQSFAGLGSSDFRQRVVIYNAVRHQEKWKNVLEELAHA